VHAGLILYLLDVTFRIAQQAYPVRLRIASVHDESQLATLQFDMDPLTPQDPIQVDSAELFMKLRARGN